LSTAQQTLADIAAIAFRKASWRTAQARLPFTDKAQMLAKLRDGPAMMQNLFCVIDELKSAWIIDRYAVTGAVGAMFYTEAFRTLDINFLVSLATTEDTMLASFAPIFAWLANRGYTQFDSGGHILIEGWPVQFLPTSDALSTEALASAHQLPFDELLVPVVQAEYLAAEALKLSRPKDVGRIDSLRRSDGFDQAIFEQLIERFELQAQWRKFQSFLKP
jgi:hypothetical protein